MIQYISRYEFESLSIKTQKKMAKLFNFNHIISRYFGDFTNVITIGRMIEVLNSLCRVKIICHHLSFDVILYESLANEILYVDEDDELRKVLWRCLVYAVENEIDIWKENKRLNLKQLKI